MQGVGSAQAAAAAAAAQQAQVAAQQQQAAAAQQAVTQAMQQAIQHRQQQGGQGAQQSITDLAVNYMSAISAANIANKGAAAAAAAGGGAPAGGAGGGVWDPRMAYPMMSHMNALTLPNMLSLQQQYAQQHPGLAGRQYNLDATNMLLANAASHNLLNGLDARKSRHIKSPGQLKQLKLFFQTNQRPSKDDIRKLTKDTGLPHQEVTRWFRNERHKEKKQQEAKNEAIQGHIKGQPQAPHTHLQGLPAHMQHLMHLQHPAAAAGRLGKRKREGEDTGSEGGDEGLHPGMYGNSPAQRTAAIQTFLSHLADPTEIDVADKALEAKRQALGIDHVPQLPLANGGGPANPEGTWQLLQQQFGSADKRKPPQGGKEAVSAAAAAAQQAGQLDPNLIRGLTQVFAKHGDYLREVAKNLGQQQQQQH